MSRTRRFQRAGLSAWPPFPLLLLTIGCGSSPTGNGDAASYADGALVDAANWDGTSTPTDGFGSDVPTGWTGDGPVQVSDAGITVTDPDGKTWTCHPTTCAGHLLQCGDCVDNDGDRRVDSRDPECLGPCDNTEGPVLLSGVGGETGGPCKADCYFDFGNGSGGEECQWDHRCDPLEVSPSYPPEGMVCAYQPPETRQPSVQCPATQPANCLSHCRPLTPNGCDCFGCCSFPGVDHHVWLGSYSGTRGNGTCTFENIHDESKCRPCTPVANCYNSCEHCEVCIGRPTPPSDCFVPAPRPDGGTATADGSTGGTDAGVVNPDQCPTGVQPCGLPGQADCSVNSYCVTGCCVPLPG